MTEKDAEIISEFKGRIPDDRIIEIGRGQGLSGRN